MTNSTTATPWLDGQAISLPCHECGGQMVGTGSIATGDILPNGYTPAAGELLRIDFIKCPDCGDAQES